MSNLFKPEFYITLDSSKLIEVIQKPILINTIEETDNKEAAEMEQQKLEEIHALQEQILKDAELSAEEQLRQAMADADEIKEAARVEIEKWWQEKRQQDEQLQEESKQAGFQAGQKEGTALAQKAVLEQYDSSIQEAQHILEQAHRLKEQIIQEAEPFLIELSCAIAEKIIQKQLTLSPEWVIEYTQSILSRRREKGLITICVAPEHFSYIQEAKDEFIRHIDSQAELQILPDSTVADHGCVIRSPFLSIDARIDTQLKEIKNALQVVAKRNEGAHDHE